MSTVQDVARREAVEEYHVVGEPVDPELERLVELAAAICDVPTAVINIIDDRHQHQVAAVGLSGDVCSLEDSMCARILDGLEQVAVVDARQDGRFRDNPFVSGRLSNVRFYASAPLVTPAGVPIGTLCVFDEVPRHLPPSAAHALRVLADQAVHVLELRLASRELERSNEHLTKFAGQVCHDLRNPLAALMWFIELAAGSSELADSPEAARLLARAESSAARMGLLISDLLAFARTGGGGPHEDVDLGEEIDVVLEDLAWQVEASEVDVRVGDLPIVSGERTLLRVLLQHLVAQALTSSATGACERPVVRVGAEEVVGGWRISVEDNGIGVSGHERDRVHALLTGDVRAGHDDHLERLDVGLSTCRRIVHAHHGRIGLADSELGGAALWVALPGQTS